MKKEMLDVPIASGGFRLFEMLFLARNWDKDKVYIENEIERLCSVDHPLWLIFFPEGTQNKLFCQKNIGILTLLHEKEPQLTHAPWKSPKHMLHKKEEPDRS